jgi:hypothetical protein
MNDDKFFAPLKKVIANACSLCIQSNCATSAPSSVDVGAPVAHKLPRVNCAATVVHSVSCFPNLEIELAVSASPIE